jgi:mRNA-degrading endonuclease toxin of MazEF toxin-antitoxin module
MNIRRGETHLAALDPVIGKELAKTRPVVVVSNDINNEYSGTVTVLPITSASLEKVYPFEVFLPKGSGRLPKDSKGTGCNHSSGHESVFDTKPEACYKNNNARFSSSRSL